MSILPHDAVGATAGCSPALGLFAPVAAAATEVNVVGVSDLKSAYLYSLFDHFKLPQ